MSEHRCDRRCEPHVCVPLKAWTIRKIHSILLRDYRRAASTLSDAVSGIAHLHNITLAG